MVRGWPPHYQYPGGRHNKKNRGAYKKDVTLMTFTSPLLLLGLRALKQHDLRMLGGDDIMQRAWQAGLMEPYKGRPLTPSQAREIIAAVESLEQQQQQQQQEKQINGYIYIHRSKSGSATNYNFQKNDKEQCPRLQRHSV
eukprot:1148038-Pelagomonas_calceolata.AAC.2